MSLFLLSDTGQIFRMTFVTDAMRTTLAMAELSTIAEMHGPLAPSRVDDIVTYDNQTFILRDDVVYRLNSTLHVTESCGFRDAKPWNIFQRAPLGICSATELPNSMAFLFKDTRFYNYNMIERRVTHGGLLIDQTR